MVMRVIRVSRMCGTSGAGRCNKSDESIKIGIWKVIRL